MPTNINKNQNEFNAVRYELEDICTEEIWNAAISQAEKRMSDIRSTEEYKKGEIDDVDVCVRVAMNTGNHLAFALSFAETGTRKNIAIRAFKEYIEKYQEESKNRILSGVKADYPDIDDIDVCVQEKMKKMRDPLAFMSKPRKDGQAICTFIEKYNAECWLNWKILKPSLWRSLNFEYTEVNLNDNAYKIETMKNWIKESDDSMPDRDVLIQCAFSLRLDSAETNRLLMNFGFRKLYELDVADFVASHYLDYYKNHENTTISDFDKRKSVFNLIQTFIRKQCLNESNLKLRAEYTTGAIKYVLLKSAIQERQQLASCHSVTCGEVNARQCPVPDRWYRFDLAFTKSLEQIKENTVTVSQENIGRIVDTAKKEIGIQATGLPYKIEEKQSEDTFVWKVVRELKLNAPLNIKLNDKFSEYAEESGNDAEILEKIKQYLIRDGLIEESGNLSCREERTIRGLEKCWTLTRLAKENSEWTTLYHKNDCSVSHIERKLKEKRVLEIGEKLVLDKLYENSVVVSLNREKFWIISQKGRHVEYKKYDLDQLLIDNISDKLKNKTVKIDKPFWQNVFEEVKQTLMENGCIAQGELEFKISVTGKNDDIFTAGKGNMKDDEFCWKFKLLKKEAILIKQAGVQATVSNIPFRYNIRSDYRRFDERDNIDTSYPTRIGEKNYSNMDGQLLSDQWLDEHAYQFIYRPFSYFKKLVDFFNDYDAYHKYMSDDDFCQIDEWQKRRRQLQQDQNLGYSDRQSNEEIEKLNEDIYEKQLGVLRALFDQRSPWIVSGVEKHEEDKKEGKLSTVRNIIEGRSVVTDVRFHTTDVGYIFNDTNITDKNSFEKWLVVTGHEDEIGLYLPIMGFWENNFADLPVKNKNYFFDRKDLLIIYALRYRDQCMDREYTDRQKMNDAKKDYDFIGLLLKIGESVLLKNRLDHNGKLKESIYGKYWELENLSEDKSYHEIFPDDLMFFDIPQKEKNTERE